MSNKACKCHGKMAKSFHNYNQVTPKVKDTMMLTWYNFCTSSWWGYTLTWTSLDHVFCGTIGLETYSLPHKWGLQSSDHIYYTCSALSLTILAILLWLHTLYLKKSTQCQEGPVKKSAYYTTLTFSEQMEANRMFSRVAVICYVVVTACRDRLLKSDRFYAKMYENLWFDLQSLRGDMRHAGTWGFFLRSVFFVCATHMTLKEPFEYIWKIRKVSVMLCVWCMMGTVFVHRGSRLSCERFLVCVARVIMSSPPSVLQTINQGNHLMNMIVRDREWHFPNRNQKIEMGVFITLIFKGFMYRMVCNTRL